MVSRLDLPEMADALSSIVSVLCKRRNIARERKTSVLRDYLRLASNMYEEYSYLPQAPPTFASNYTYAKAFSHGELKPKLEKLASILSDLAPDAEPNNPYGALQLIVTGTVALCVEYPRSGIPEATFKIGSVSVGVEGYCSLMGHAHISSLIVAAHEYIYYALSFIEEALSSFVNTTKVTACKDCEEQARKATGLEGIRRFQAECGECYERFRRELTSRSLPAFRGFLLGLYGLKWFYSANQALGYETRGLIIPFAGKGGVRHNYSVIPTLLGRVIAHSIETWSGRIPDYSLLEAISRVTGLYLKLFDQFRVEARSISRNATRESVYTMNSVLEWLSSIRKILEEEPPLVMVAPADLGSVVDDLINYVINERIHWYASISLAPEAAEAFTWFQDLDIEALVIDRIVRGRR